MAIEEDENLKMKYADNTVNNYDMELEKDIDLITKSLSRPYFNSALKKLTRENPNNARIICEYILTEQTEFNIKESTKEGKIKVLVWLSNFHGKNFIDITKQDILKYLNNLRKSSEEDPSHKWIGSCNGRQAVFLKFFKWLHNLDESDYRKRISLFVCKE